MIAQVPDGEADVVVVGGGPTGLAAALELSRRGVHATLIEPRAEVSELRPRAKTTSVRTMALFRRWGLADTLRAASHLPVEWSQDVVFCTNLLGTEITRFTGCFGLTTERSPLYSESSQQVHQFVVEKVLRAAVEAEPTCSACYGWTASSLDLGSDEVVVRLRGPSGEARDVRTRYVLGCDGASGVVRPAIGAGWSGSEHPRQNLTAVFRSPGLAERVPHGRAIQYWVLQPGASAYMGRFDLVDRWWIGLIGVSPDLAGSDLRSCIQLAVGAPVEIEVLATDPWTSRMLIAGSFAAEGAMLCGDAAHLNPPWGGHGFNTGIGDATNLAWKLAAVVAGWGGPGLLDSYEQERRPVAEQTIALAARHTSLLSADFADPVLLEDSPRGKEARAAAAEEIEDKKRDEFHALGLVLGYHYERSIIVATEHSGGERGARPSAMTSDVSRYVPSARPGHLLPHAWVGPTDSLYDHLGDWFTLLWLGVADPGPLVVAAERRGVPLALADLRDRHLDYGAPLILVRPDQHVAWRGATVPHPEDLVDLLRGARSRAP